MIHGLPDKARLWFAEKGFKLLNSVRIQVRRHRSISAIEQYPADETTCTEEGAVIEVPVRVLNELYQRDQIYKQFVGHSGELLLDYFIDKTIAENELRKSNPAVAEAYQKYLTIRNLSTNDPKILDDYSSD